MTVRRSLPGVAIVLAPATGGTIGMPLVDGSSPRLLVLITALTSMVVGLVLGVTQRDRGR